MINKYSIEKPEPAGKLVGYIYKDLGIFQEARTRIFNGMKKCQTAEAFEVYEKADEALAQLSIEFHESRRKEIK